MDSIKKTTFISAYTFSFLLLCSHGVTAADTLYKKVNPDGSIEYSDTPIQGGEEIEKKQAPVTNLKPAPRLTPSFTIPSVEAGYKSLEITSPENDASIRENMGNLGFTASLQPGLKSGHQVQWLMDGKLLDQAGLSIQLQNVDRGSHTVVVQVVDAEGEVLIKSSPVTVHLLRYFKKPAPPTPPKKTP